MKHYSLPKANATGSLFGKMRTTLLLIPFLIGVLQSCCPKDDINPNLIYGEWKLTSYTNSSDDIKVQTEYLIFWKDNVMSISQDAAQNYVVGFFDIVDDKLYFYNNLQERRDNYLTIIELKRNTLTLRADFTGDKWSECTFKKHGESGEYGYYNPNGGVAGTIIEITK